MNKKNPILFCFAVIYLVVFHICFVLFMWSYWKTIISKPSNPSKAVWHFDTPLISSLKKPVFWRYKAVSVTYKHRLTMLLFLIYSASVLFTKSRKRGVWKRRKTRGPAGDPEKSCQKFEHMHMYWIWRSALKSSYKIVVRIQL